MTHLIRSSAIGAAAGACPVLIVVGASPWRPSAAWVAVAVLAATTVAAALGVLAVARRAGMSDAGHVARITALGTPIFSGLLLMMFLNAFGPGSDGIQQLAALGSGAAAAGAMAGRFGVPDEDG